MIRLTRAQWPDLMARAPLRRITSKRVHVVQRRVRTMRGQYGISVKVFRIFVECGHELEVQFARRPQVGRRIRCIECAALPD